MSFYFQAWTAAVVQCVQLLEFPSKPNEKRCAGPGGHGWCLPQQHHSTIYTSAGWLAENLQKGMYWDLTFWLYIYYYPFSLFYFLLDHILVISAPSQDKKFYLIFSLKCREIGYESHEELLKVLHELHTTMRTYHTYQTEFKNAETKLRNFEAQRTKLEQAIPKEKLEKSKKFRVIEKEIQKVSWCCVRCAWC